MTSSPLCTARTARWPLSLSLPGPTARTRPRCGFCLALSGNKMPPAVTSSASSGSTTTRSSRGRTLKLMSFSFAMIVFSVLFLVITSCPCHPYHPCHPYLPYHPYHPYHPYLHRGGRGRPLSSPSQGCPR